MDVVESVRALYPRLIDGDIGVLSSFCEKATADSPLGAKQLPPEFVAETRAWLARHDARSAMLHTTVTPGRIVHELTLWLMMDGEECELPVMLVADVAEDCIRDLRVYHSTWPITGKHAVRPPLMQYALAERPAEPVGSYHAALAAGDAAAADAQYEPNGTVREPAGTAYAHGGGDRTTWYRMVLGDGPLVLHLGTIADDGETLVYEYLVDQWGGTRMPRQAGAAAYQRGPSGKILSARIYDDVDPPAALAAG